MKPKYSFLTLLAGLSSAAMPCLAQDRNPPQPTTPRYLDQIERDSTKAAQRTRIPAATSPRSETAALNRPAGTQLAFFELTPTMGSMSIKNQSAFTIGANLSFRLTANSGLYFEPSLLMSFLSGDRQNVTLFHVDGGLRYDWVINDSALIPFVKVAVGPTIASNNATTVKGDLVSDSYVNLLAGGGLKILVNPRIGVRVDTGVALQGTDTGLYLLGSVALPL